MESGEQFVLLVLARKKQVNYVCYCTSVISFDLIFNVCNYKKV